ncbi:hypothetical protein VTL71DRAFT_9672 [Oculimacula yallundae]|uniref:Uncharacterized protein n=1 Tax=Oculimacula yallundae TaxID=86028 RepID=A0ABR4BRH2_9HELO
MDGAKRQRMTPSHSDQIRDQVENPKFDKATLVSIQIPPYNASIARHDSESSIARIPDTPLVEGLPSIGRTSCTPAEVSSYDSSSDRPKSGPIIADVANPAAMEGSHIDLRSDPPGAKQVPLYDMTSTLGEALEKWEQELEQRYEALQGSKTLELRAALAKSQMAQQFENTNHRETMSRLDIVQKSEVKLKAELSELKRKDNESARANEVWRKATWRRMVKDSKSMDEGERNAIRQCHHEHLVKARYEAYQEGLLDGRASSNITRTKPWLCPSDGGRLDSKASGVQGTVERSRISLSEIAGLKATDPPQNFKHHSTPASAGPRRSIEGGSSNNLRQRNCLGTHEASAVLRTIDEKRTVASKNSKDSPTAITSLLDQASNSTINGTTFRPSNRPVLDRDPSTSSASESDSPIPAVRKCKKTGTVSVSGTRHV